MMSPIVLLCFILIGDHLQAQTLPIIVTTWQSTRIASREAWDLMVNQGQDVVESIVGGCTVCEIDKTCGTSIGYGDRPDENGEVTLDAMIMDGRTMDLGSVCSLRRVKNAIGVAHAVLKHTEHSILAGELATEFAVQMGFPEEPLNNSNSDNLYANWLLNNCQPNYWTDVSPDPATNCGPYTPIVTAVKTRNNRPFLEHARQVARGEEPEHDTIGMVAVDVNGNVASGCTTNGMTHKIPGRTGDSPIVGAGGYAENGVGAASCTGDGDVMVRMLPSFHTVQLMAGGLSPMEAAEAAMERVKLYYPSNGAGIVAVNATGSYGAACHNFGSFAFHYISAETGDTVDESVPCI